MKYCVLTQPLGTNYGGLLQAFALQKVLRDLGHEVLTLDRPLPQRPFLRKCRTATKRAFLYYAARNKAFGCRPWMWPSLQEQTVIRKHTMQFIRQHITTTPPLDTLDKVYSLNDYGFDGYVVGSDQVWRPCYSPGLFTYFLDFTKDYSVKRVAYAASFGSDQWEIDPKTTFGCARLAKCFDAISVREESGIQLCKEYLGVNAEQMPDPTMLLNQNDYDAVIQNGRPEIPSKPFLCSYILDSTPEKDSVASSIASSKNLEIFSPMPKRSFHNARSNQLSDCVFPAVETWLAAIKYADCVVTDSFHGTVFSVLYNKPFAVLDNPQRGSSRIQYFLKSLSVAEDNPQNCVPHLRRYFERDCYLTGEKLIAESLRGHGYLKQHLDSALPTDFQGN